jgi:hypothetical protein
MNVGIIMLQDKELAAWQAEMEVQLYKLPFIDSVFYIIIPHLQKQGSTPSIAYRIFSTMEKAWFKGVPDAKKTARLRGISFELSTDADKPLMLDEKGKNSIQEFAPDIIFGVGLDLEEENLSGLLPYGLWSLCLGKNSDPAFTGFSEVMNDDPVIEATLEVKYQGNRYLVYNGSTATVPYSVRNTFHSVAWKAASFLPARLNELYSNGPQLFFSSEREKTSPVPAVLQAPGNRTIVVSSARNVQRYLSWRKKAKSSPSFTLLYRHESFHEHIDFSSFTPLTAPAGMFWADPFVLEKQGTKYIFFEEYAEAKGRAHISLITIDAAGNVSSPCIVLEKPFHLSYPFIVEHEGEVYMIPETASARRVELYRAKNFPFNWELEKTLMNDVILIDATLLFHERKWWMFGTTQNHPFTSTNDQLMLYYSDSLFSQQWTPHPQNPIVTRIEHCRPAGAFFRRDGKLFRPAQNNASRQYGYAISIMEVLELNTKFYCEKQVHSFLPTPPLKALHTLNFTSSFTVIDGIVEGL